MGKRNICRIRLPIGLWALLCAVLAGSCNLPPEPVGEEGTLTLILPRVSAPAAGASRSVLSNAFIGTLAYRVTLTNSSIGTTVIDPVGGGTTISLKTGEWAIEALAYVLGVPGTTVGTGEASVTIEAGQDTTKTISMSVDPAYEAALLDIYIHNEAELRRIGAAANGLAIDDPDRIFYLENSIVLEQPWTPIGNVSTPFKAKFDGQGHTVTVKSFGGPGFPVKESGSNFVNQGFFAGVENTQIKNITIAYNLADPVVDIRTGEGSTYYSCNAGGVAGFADSTSFENVRVTGNFSVIADGDSNLGVGGIAGQVNSGTTIANCHVTGNIGGTSKNYLTIGGIAGIIDGPITGSSFTGVINGSAPYGNCDAGGIAGYTDSEITGCFAEGYIRAEADYPRVGGIAGVMDGGSSGGSITRSYAAGRIESIASGTHSDSGGIAGRLNGSNDTIENCYALADVSSSSTYGEMAGGIAGTNGGTISKCYAAGTVKSKGHEPYTYIGGIAGEHSNNPTISACMALVSELDGGPSTSSSKNVHAISADASILTGNYSRTGFTRNNANASDTVDYGSTGKDGEQKNLADFKSQALYTGALWNFAAGTGDWKFITGYDYPVLSWQIAAPGGESMVADGNGGFEFQWD
jgi:hypothetical protein